MDKTARQNAEIVTDALEEYYQNIVESGQFDLRNFIDFMEPKFGDNGYREPSQRTSILIIHDCGAGDFIVQSALIREVRRVYPDAYIVLLVSPVAYQLSRNCPYVQEIIVNERQFAFNLVFTERYKWCVALSRQLLEYHFDLCFAVVHNPCTPLIMYMCGAHTRISHLIKDDDEASRFQKTDISVQYMLSLATHRQPIFTYGVHAVDFGLSLLDHTLHVPVSNRDMEVWYTPVEMNFARSLISDLNGSVYGLCMGGSGLKKHYPPEKYAELVKLILKEEQDATFVILGAGKNDLVSSQILKDNLGEISDKSIIDLTNKISYCQSAAVLKLCNMYIGNDTGTMHASAAVKCPVLMVKCSPADAPYNPNDSINSWYPYHVPSVTIQPEHLLPECANKEFYDTMGCISDHPHCITQVTSEKIFEGFHILKQRIAEKNIEPYNIY